MRVRGREIAVDVEEELEPYLDQLNGHRIRGNKLQACSPFRDERHPSFAVNLETGTYIDSGGIDESLAKGGLVKLLAFLSRSDYEEIEDYLLTKYDTLYKDVDSLTLNVQLETPETARIYTVEDLKPWAYRNPYLSNRGITEQVQRAFRIGYDRGHKAITMPWTDKAGNVINIKRRSIEKKVFWYEPDGQPIKQHIYGLQFITRKRSTTAVIVESETDCLYLWSNGIPALALGSANLSRYQEALLINSPLERVILGLDNDGPGQRATEDIVDRLLGKLQVYGTAIPDGFKDMNDLPPDLLHQVVNGAVVRGPVLLLKNV